MYTASFPSSFGASGLSGAGMGGLTSSYLGGLGVASPFGTPMGTTPYSPVMSGMASSGATPFLGGFGSTGMGGVWAGGLSQPSFGGGMFGNTTGLSLQPPQTGPDAQVPQFSFPSTSGFPGMQPPQTGPDAAPQFSFPSNGGFGQTATFGASSGMQFGGVYPTMQQFGGGAFGGAAGFGQFPTTSAGTFGGMFPPTAVGGAGFPTLQPPQTGPDAQPQFPAGGMTYTPTQFPGMQPPQTGPDAQAPQGTQFPPTATFMGGMGGFPGAATPTMGLPSTMGTNPPYLPMGGMPGMPGQAPAGAFPPGATPFGMPPTQPPQTGPDASPAPVFPGFQPGQPGQPGGAAFPPTGGIPGVPTNEPVKGLKVIIYNVSGLPKGDIFGHTDIYVKATVDGGAPETTHTVNADGSTAELNTELNLPAGRSLRLEVWDKDTIGKDDNMGWIQVDVGNLPPGIQHRENLALQELKTKGESTPAVDFMIVTL